MWEERKRNRGTKKREELEKGKGGRKTMRESEIGREKIMRERERIRKLGR